ncbi:MAG: type I restriction enzyme HsdR N-terminal domain-containing protein [Zavarzinia sp.]|nr:type I restriction enzyme HsdR N-terminal domain-containing protein [Zavarzinia sp.]
MDEFSRTIVERAKALVQRAEACTNEQAVKQSLILPFLAFLGYDVFDPSEVAPEHHADFSEKYQNKVDYAILRAGEAVIGIEAKGPGSAMRDDRGQLKSYFNAVRTIKLGILTNGIVWQCFADSDEPNMMDDAPFLIFDLAKIAEGQIDQPVASGIADLRKSVFDPQNIGAEARRKLLLQSFMKSLRSWRDAPPDELVRLLLDRAGHEGKKTSKIVDESRDLVRIAFGAVIDNEILNRVGLADRSVIRVDEAPSPPIEAAVATVDSIETTEAEMAAYQYALRRLAFLVKDETEYAAISDIRYQDYKTTFRVFYKRPNAGGLFNLKENRDGTLTFDFPVLDGQTITTAQISDIDKPLIESFRLRVAGK